MSKRKAKAVAFTAKRRKDLAVDLAKRDYADVVDSAIAKLQRGVHLKLYPARSQFVETVCSEKVKPTLTQCAMEMVSLYIDMYRSCMIGKRFAEFEHQWFKHLEQYFSGSTSQSHSPATLWAHVVERASLFGAPLPIREQRIVLATLAYHIHDLMVDRVKEYKQNLDSTTSDAITDDTPAKVFYESKTSLLRYGGFALHSMIKKRKKATGSTTSTNHDTLSKSERQFLESLKSKEEETELIPSAIHHLQQGGLTIITPRFIPFLREVLSKTASLVNEKTCKDLGKNMLLWAKEEITNEVTTAAFFKLFNECLPCTCESILTSEQKKMLCNEFTSKLFHARINEYFSAAEEIELEQSGKAVKAEQGLRDSLKTFSSMKSRPY